MNNNYVDMADYLDKYPPCQVCDEFDECADYYDRHAMDMPCVDCDEYRELVEMEKRAKIMREILFRGKRKDNGEWVEGE